MSKKNIAVLDSQWGDCGKGRIAHYFSPQFDWLVRQNGSSNSGHVVYRDGKKYTHHLLPSVDYRNPNTKSFLSHGMVINLEELLSEILEFEKDFSGMAKTIYVDPDTFVITKDHIERDQINNKNTTSTGKGVQPAYTDKMARCGVRIYDYIRDNSEIITKLKDLGINFTPILSLKSVFEKSSLCFEGAQSVLLDINAGPNYPYVTSSDCTVSGIYAAGFNFITLDKVYGCQKPYLTKVGVGNMPTEYFGDEAEILRKLGNEFGNTTGRARRIGALDLVATKYAINKGGLSHIIINKMDILNGFETVKVCHSYGKEVFSPSDFINIKPEYINLPGWKDSKNIEQTKYFLQYIEEKLECEIDFISTGVNDEDIINIL